MSEVYIDNLTHIFAIQDAHLKFDEQIRWSSLARMSNIDHVSLGHSALQGATQAEMSHHVNKPPSTTPLEDQIGVGGRAGGGVWQFGCCLCGLGPAEDPGDPGPGRVWSCGVDGGRKVWMIHFGRPDRWRKIGDLGESLNGVVYARGEGQNLG